MASIRLGVRSPFEFPVQGPGIPDNNATAVLAGPTSTIIVTTIRNLIAQVSDAQGVNR